MKGKPDMGKPKDTEETPFQRFLRVARHVVNVPKSDIEKREQTRKPKEGSA